MFRGVLILSLVLGVSVLSQPLLHAGLVTGLGKLSRLTAKELKGSSWSIAGIMKTKIKNIGKTEGPMRGDLFFGPQDVSFESEDVTLADHQFLLVLDDGESRMWMSGNYSVPAFLKKPVLSPDPGTFQDELKVFIQETTPGVEVEVVRVRLDAVAKRKDRGDKIRIKLKTQFLVDDGEILKGFFTYKGKGSRAP